MRNIKHDIRNFLGIERHRHNDVADAGGLGRIGTGLVNTRGSGVHGCCRERRAARKRGAQKGTTRELLGHDFL